MKSGVPSSTVSPTFTYTSATLYSWFCSMDQVSWDSTTPENRFIIPFELPMPVIAATDSTKTAFSGSTGPEPFLLTANTMTPISTAAATRPMISFFPPLFFMCYVLLLSLSGISLIVIHEKVEQSLLVDDLTAPFFSIKILRPRRELK